MIYYELTLYYMGSITCKNKVACVCVCMCVSVCVHEWMPNCASIVY